MESAMKKKTASRDNETGCPLISNPRLRLATDAQTATIKDNFPSGIAQPALRALFTAGIAYVRTLPKK